MPSKPHFMKQADIVVYILYIQEAHASPPTPLLGTGQRAQLFLFREAMYRCNRLRRVSNVVSARSRDTIMFGGFLLMRPVVS